MVKNTSRSGGINIGSATLLTLFAVLCLTIFSLLSLMSANNEWALATRTAEANTAYYVADLEAAKILEQLQAGEMPDGVTSEFFGGYSYSVPIDDAQILKVELGFDMSVTTWQVISVAEWAPDDSLDVWDGSSPLG